MRYLGLDLGSRTLGVAVSDATGLLASSYKTIRHQEEYAKLVDEVASLVKELKIDAIVLGFPKNMNNTIGPRGETTLEFKKMLESELGLEVILQDERLSTVEATHYLLQADLSRKKRKKKVDSLAANIILQTYLDKKRG